MQVEASTLTTGSFILAGTTRTGGALRGKVNEIHPLGSDPAVLAGWVSNGHGWERGFTLNTADLVEVDDLADLDTRFWECAHDEHAQCTGSESAPVTVCSCPCHASDGQAQ